MPDSILHENPVARTPVTRPRPGMKYEHLDHGIVEVRTVEENMVVFARPWGSEGQAYINERQQPIDRFQARTVDLQ